MPPKLPPLPLPRLVTKKLMLLGAPELLEPLAPLAPLPAEPAAADPPAPVLALPPVEPADCSLSVVLSESSEQAVVAINKSVRLDAKR
jgi:hypothetical protein